MDYNAQELKRHVTRAELCKVSERLARRKAAGNYTPAAGVLAFMRVLNTAAKRAVAKMRPYDSGRRQSPTAVFPRASRVPLAKFYEVSFREAYAQGRLNHCLPGNKQVRARAREAADPALFGRVMRAHSRITAKRKPRPLEPRRYAVIWSEPGATGGARGVERLFSDKAAALRFAKSLHADGRRARVAGPRGWVAVKTAKRKTAKRKTAKRKTAKRKTAKRKTAKRKTAKRKTAKRKTAKRGRKTVLRGAAFVRKMAAAKKKKAAARKRKVKASGKRRRPAKRKARRR